MNEAWFLLCNTKEEAEYYRIKYDLPTRIIGEIDRYNGCFTHLNYTKYCPPKAVIIEGSIAFGDLSCSPLF